jgi:hypothetical protein
MSVCAEDIAEQPDRIVYCLHCDGAFKARDLQVMRDLKGRDLGVVCGDRACDGGFLDLDFDPWWRQDWICVRCGEEPRVCECEEGVLLPEKYR